MNGNSKNCLYQPDFSTLKKIPTNVRENDSDNSFYKVSYEGQISEKQSLNRKEQGSDNPITQVNRFDPEIDHTRNNHNKESLKANNFMTQFQMNVLMRSSKDFEQQLIEDIEQMSNA